MPSCISDIVSTLFSEPITSRGFDPFSRTQHPFFLPVCLSILRRVDINPQSSFANKRLNLYRLLEPLLLLSRITHLPFHALVFKHTVKGDVLLIIFSEIYSARYFIHISVGQISDDFLDFSLRYERGLEPHRLGHLRADIKHIAGTEKFSAPPVSRIVLESICEATWRAILDGIFALIRPVMTFTDGLWVEENKMDADRSAHLRQSYDCRLQLARIRLHNVGQLVYHDYEIGHSFNIFFFSAVCVVFVFAGFLLSSIF